MSKGWIQIPRSILDQQFFRDADTVHLYLYLHLKAAYKPTMDMFDGKEYKLEKGDLITGRKRIAADLGMDESKVERILKRLQSARKVNTRKGRRMRLISVVYEVEENQSERETNAKRTRSDSETNTFIKKENNNKKKNVDDDDTAIVDRSYYDELFSQMGMDGRARTLLMKNYKIDQHQLKHLAQRFFDAQEINRKQWPSYAECLKHFTNWLTKQGDAVRAPLQDQHFDKADIDDFYNSRMGPADRLD